MSTATGADEVLQTVQILYVLPKTAAVKFELIPIIRSTRFYYSHLAVFSTYQCILRVQDSCNFTTAVVVYDWLLTFPDEFRLIWKRKLTGARILFLLNIYLFLSFNLTQVINDRALGFSDNVSTLAFKLTGCTTAQCKLF